MNNTIYFVTTNQHKSDTYAERLRQIGWDVKTIPVELPESRDFDVATVARKKLLEAARQVEHRPIMVEDRGLRIASLNDFPKSHVKVATDLLGIPKLMEIVDQDNPAATFDYSVGLMEEDGTVKMFHGSETGKIIKRNPDEVKSLFDVFCSTAVPDKPLSALSDEEEKIYQAYWTKDDALTKLMAYLTSHE